MKQAQSPIKMPICSPNNESYVTKQDKSYSDVKLYKEIIMKQT